MNNLKEIILPFNINIVISERLDTFITSYFLKIPLPNHFSDILSAVPSFITSSKALSTASLKLLSVFLKPTP